MTDQERTYRVSDIMSTRVPTVAPTDSVGTIARLLGEHRVPGVPVVTEDGEIVGIVTEGDIVERDAEVSVPSFFSFFDAVIEIDGGRPFPEEMRHALAMTAEDLMSSPVFNILPTATLTELATLMIQENVNPVPVVTDNLELIGIVSRADLVRIIAKLESGADSSATADSTP